MNEQGMPNDLATVSFDNDTQVSELETAGEGNALVREVAKVFEIHTVSNLSKKGKAEGLVCESSS